jgi:hypothetical protein
MARGAACRGIDAMPDGHLSADLIADIYEAAIDDGAGRALPIWSRPRPASKVSEFGSSTRDRSSTCR